MCCERLVCAACAGPVAEAGCGVCRASRASVHPSVAVSLGGALQALLVMVAALAVLALLTY